MSRTNQFKFTQRSIDQLPSCPLESASKATEYTDTEVVGLKVQVNKSGRKVFYWRYTYRGNKRAAKLGEFPATDVSNARKRALEMRGILDQGIDPQEGQDRLKSMPTFAEYVQREYLPMAYQTKRSAKDDESKFRIHLFPRFGNCKLGEITTRDIQAYIGDIANSHSKATANRHYSLLARLFKLAVIWEVIQRSPCAGVTKFREQKVRERFLAPEEIARLYAAMATEKNQVAAAALRFLLLTGLRRGEVLGAKWEQIDLERGMMYLPVTKAGRPRHAILNEQAKELLKGLASRLDSPWVFPGKYGNKGLDNPVKCFRRLLAAAGIDQMRIHDLRHSFASTAINAGATLYEVQALLGHSSPAMTMRYSHLTDGSLRRASNSVGEVVAQAVSGVPAGAQ